MRQASDDSVDVFNRHDDLASGGESFASPLLTSFHEDSQFCREGRAPDLPTPESGVLVVDYIAGLRDLGATTLAKVHRLLCFIGHYTAAEWVASTPPTPGID